jgi:Protein of unknown function (DUF2934)
MSPQMTKTPPAKVAADQNLEQEIRNRAYALYEERGREDGRDLDDWLCAEMEITAAVRKAA